MRIEVEKYLADYQEKMKKRILEEEKKKEREEANKRAKTLIRAGLYTVGEGEITKKEFYDDPYGNCYSKRIKGEKHYYCREMKFPLQVTDEEYAAILSTMQDEMNDESQTNDATENMHRNSQSGAALFFAIIAAILWVGGLFVSILVSNSTLNSIQSPFVLFISTYIVYFLSGCFAMCAAELFKRLQDILNVLKDTYKTISTMKNQG